MKCIYRGWLLAIFLVCSFFGQAVAQDSVGAPACGAQITGHSCPPISSNSCVTTPTNGAILCYDTVANIIYAPDLNTGFYDVPVAGGGGGGGLNGVTVTNTPSGANQYLGSTSTSTAAWGSGQLPALGNPGYALYQNAAGSSSVWAACSGDLLCSAVTPGSYTVTRIQGNPVLAGTPGGDAYFYVWNQGQGQFIAVPVSGDVAMSNSGRMTVSKINGVSVGPLATQQLPCTVTEGCNGADLSVSAGLIRAGSSPLAASELSGDVTTSGSNATTVVNTHLSAPLPQNQGGTNSASPGGTAGTGLSVSGSFPTQQYALQVPVTVANGGTQCGAPTLFANLPGSPTLAEVCGVTDSAQGCVAGTTVTSGTGTPTSFCLVTWDGSDWEPASGATVPATGGGFSTAGTGLTSSGSTVSLLTPIAANLGGTGADLSALSGILRAGNPITSSIVRAGDTDTSIAHTGVDINTSHQVVSTHLTNALPLNQGGTNCKATSFGTLPLSPTPGTTCSITDANVCSVGSTISSGGGSMIPECTIRWNGSAWIASDVTSTNPLLIGVQVNAQSGISGSFFDSNAPNASTSGLVNDVNNSAVTIAAKDVQNDSNDIQEIGTDNLNVVHIGGGGATGISFDNPSTVSQGGFASGNYQDIAFNSLNFMGGNESCAQNLHNYTLTSNSTITLNCPGTNNQRLTFYLTQPASGSTFTYTFVAGGNAQLLGDAPTACNLNGCIDEVTVDWIPSPAPTYIVNLVKSNITGGTTGPPPQTCPTGQICYYVSSSTGNDTNNGTSTATPWATIGKANEIVSSLNPGDEILFKSGDTWTGTSGYATSSPFNNHTFFLGDNDAGTATHSLNATTAASSLLPSHPIVISTYNGSAPAVFDMANLQPQCFAEVNPNNGNPPITTRVKYFTIKNFTCERAYVQGIKIDPNGAVSPGMQILNNTIIHTGYGYSDSLSSCTSSVPVDSSLNTFPPLWQQSHHYVGGQSATTNAMIEASVTNTNQAVWYYAVSDCTSASGAGPAFSTSSCTYGGADITGDNNCTWRCAGHRGFSYNNQLQYFDSTDAGNSIVFKGNNVSCGGGHNLLEVEGDTGSPIVQSNVIGPGGIHGGIDLKVSGNTLSTPATVATIVQNIVTCGVSKGTCGCQLTSPNTCNGGQTPSLFTEDWKTLIHANYVFQENTVYDSFLGLQDTVSSPIGGTNGCSGNCASPSGTCPSNVKYYNNTAYLSLSQPSYCVYAGGGTCNKGGSQLDIRNNICDGAKTLFNVPTGNAGSDWASTTENYNDLGGVQGFTNSYSFRASSTPGTSDYCPSCSRSTATDPSYNCENGNTCNTFTSGVPNFGLQSGSIARTLNGVAAGTSLPNPPGNMGNFSMGANP